MPKPAQLDDILSTVRSLVMEESPSSDRDAVSRSATLIAELGEVILGAPAERIEIGGVNHLRWSFGEQTRVLLLAHHDTVWPLGTLERIPYTVADGRLTGPGCFDMKTGLAMAMHAVAALEDRRGVTLLVTGDEEVGSVNSRAVIESTAHGAVAVLVLEASAEGGALKLERKGVSLYEIVLGGVSAHAGLEPEKGVNALLELAHQLLAISRLAEPELGTTITPTLAAAGSTSNTVPATARLTVDVRASTADEQYRVDESLRRLRPALEGASLEILGGVNRLPFERSASSKLFERAVGLAERLGLDPLEGVAVGGASDGNFTAALGIPTLDGLGAVGGGAHAESEHVIVAEIEPRTRLLGALVAELLAEAGAGGR